MNPSITRIAYKYMNILDDRLQLMPDYQAEKLAAEMLREELNQEETRTASHYKMAGNIPFLKQALRKIQIQKLMQTGQFAMLTAYRNEEGKNWNKRQQTELLKDLMRMGYKGKKVVPLKASWDGKTEQSYLVLGIPFGQAKQMGVKYRQDAIVWKGSGEPWAGLYYFNGPNAGKVEIALDMRKTALGLSDVPYKLDKGDDLYSKVQDLSFELDFHWGKFLNTRGGAIKPQQVVQWFKTYFGIDVSISNNKIEYDLSKTMALPQSFSYPSSPYDLRQNDN